MIYMKRYAILFCLILMTLPGFNQSYVGTVINQESSKTIDGVSLCILSADSLIISYAITDQKGQFEIKLPETKLKPALLSFQALGFKRKVVKIVPGQSEYRMFLQEEVYQLQAVKVSAQRIQQKQDTLVYSVAGFSQPQDRSIADVLAKMPGIEIKPDGMISFQGKNINKFYIEGMDLMNDRYALASNNISRKRVKAVEVLQNHQPIELLKGKLFSEQAAINLILEDDSKMNLVGTADAGLGANADDMLYSNRLLAMLFKKKYQTLSLYKNDNTGLDLYNEVNSIRLSDLLENRTIEEDALISSVTTQRPDIDQNRYRFNHSHLVATNHLFQLAPKSTLRAQVSYFNDVAERNNWVETNYLLAENASGTLIESHSLHERRNRLDASLNVEINKKELYLKNEGKASFDWLDSRSNTVWNDNQLKLHSSPDRRYFSDILDIKLPLSNERYLSISSVNGYNYHPQELSLYSGENQKVGYTSFQTYTTAAFRHRFFGLYANYQVGFQGIFQSLSAQTGNSETLPSQRFNRYLPHIGLGLNYQTSDFQVEAEAKLLRMDIRFRHPEALQRHGEFYPDAKLFLKYTFSGTSFVSMTYQYGKQLEDLRDVYAGNLFTSYRIIVDNTHTPEANSNHRVTMNYQYSHPIKGLFFSISATAKRFQKETAYESRLTEGNEVLVRSLTAAPHHANMYLVTSRLSKSFSAWKSLLTLSGTYMRNQDALLYEGTLTDYDMDSYSAVISYSGRPLSWLSVELRSLWQQNRMHSPSADSRVNQLKHSIDFNFPVTEKLMFSVSNACHQSLETEEHSWFSDLSARYTYKKLEFQLKANNILGKSVYEREFVSSIERNYNRFTLRPREFLVGVSFAL